MSTEQNVSSIAEYKICAILKYYNESIMKKNQLEESMISNKRHKLCLFCFYVL